MMSLPGCHTCRLAADSFCSSQLARTHEAGYLKTQADYSSWLGFLLLFLVSFLNARNVHADGPLVQVRFKNGGHAQGVLLPGTAPNSVRLDCRAFVEPMEFDVHSIASFEVTQPSTAIANFAHRFYLSDGSSITGQLVSIEEDVYLVKSQALGDVRLPAAAITEFVRSIDAGSVLNMGPIRQRDWVAHKDVPGWKSDSGKLVSSAPGCMMFGNVSLPEVCEVRMSWSWSGRASFYSIIGCTIPDKALERIEGAVAIAFEENTVKLFRESTTSADFTVLPPIAKDVQRLDLVLYLDQRKGVVAAASPDGRLLGKVVCEKPWDPRATSIMISNQETSKTSNELSLEYCEIRTWDGKLPELIESSSGVLLLDNQPSKKGVPKSLAPGGKDLIVEGDQGETATVPLDTVQRVILRERGKRQARPEDAVELQLTDGSLIEGTWFDTEHSPLQFQLANNSAKVSLQPRDILRWNGSRVRPTDQPSGQRVGELVNEHVTIRGWLEEGPSNQHLRWIPFVSSKGVTLNSKSPGKVAFASLPPSTPVTTSQVNPLQQARGLPPRDIVIVNGRAVRRSSAMASPQKKMIPGLRLRSGDDITAQVISINEAGVEFISQETTAHFLRHELIDSIALTTSRATDRETPDKLKRLMTVPRTLKTDPPTHLVISKSGDYLRGRLTGMDENSVIMEVRFEPQKIPREEVAEIIWLYQRSWEDPDQDAEEKGQTNKPGEPSIPEKQADNSKIASSEPDVRSNTRSNQNPKLELNTLGPLQCFVIRTNNRALSFVPQGVFSGGLTGKNPHLGDCSVSLADVAVIYYGDDAVKNAQFVRPSPWMLSIATAPRVFSESSNGAGTDSSPLVGKPAPDFSLISTSGEAIRLSQYKGSVLVLDFWASWCGPCMQTMPQVEKVVEKLHEEKVQLLAINLQEPRDRAAAAMTRLAISPTVLLDTDGKVAQTYQASAIPQTVIVDREGIITHLFVGGGPKFVNQLEAALKETLAKPSLP